MTVKDFFNFKKPYLWVTLAVVAVLGFAGVVSVLDKEEPVEQVEVPPAEEVTVEIEEVEKEPEKTDSKRLYTDAEIKQILTVDSKYKNELKFMSVLGCRVHELCNVKVKNFDLKNLTVYIEGKGGRPSNRPILPTEINFIKELIKGKGQDERVFKVPINEKETRSLIGSEIRRITKFLLPLLVLRAAVMHP